MTLQVAKAQQRPQRGDQVPRRPRATPAALAEHEVRDLTRRQGTKIALIPGQVLREEQLGVAHMPADGAGHQPALLRQVDAVIPDHLLHRRARRRQHRLRRHALPAQKAQQGRQAALRSPARMASTAPGPQELLCSLRRQLPGTQPAAGKPAAQVRHQPELIGCRQPRVTQLGELLAKTSRLRLQWPGHPDTEQVGHRDRLLLE
jgi:hypothetical protein